MLKILNVANNQNFLQYIIGHKPDAIAYIKGGREYPNINGKTEFYQTTYGVLVLTEVNGLPKINSNRDFFGFHIHAGDSCSETNGVPFENANGHYNPDNFSHPYHAGDLPPLLSNNGYSYELVLVNKFTVKEILNRTVIIHSNPDDFRTDPDGLSGERIACGKIITRL